jgi:hypothetical protein
MASNHARRSSIDAPEVYYPPTPPPPSNIVPDQSASCITAELAVNHLPTPPADHSPSNIESNSAAYVPGHVQSPPRQHYSNTNHRDSLPGSQLIKQLNRLPPTPISPPPPRGSSVSSPGYFQTGTWQSQHFPPPLASAPQPTISYGSYSTPILSPAATPAVDVHYAPNYTPQRTNSPQQYFPPPTSPAPAGSTSPQQYFPPPPASPAPAGCSVKLSSNASPGPLYFPPPPCSQPTAALSRPAVASLPQFPAYIPVQSSPSVVLNTSPPYGASHQYWAGASTQSLPNSHLSPSPSSNYMANSFSNLSLANHDTKNSSPAAAADDVTEHWSKRFVGNTLAGRVVRASMKSVTATVQLPMYLSPWGDNNPVTLPNIRKRDAALAVVGHFGAEALAPSALEVTGEVLKFGAVQAAERTADAGIDHLTPGRAAAVKHRNGVRSTQIKIKHKLMGSDANLRYVGGKPALHQADYSKGWFCPLLFASGRTPSIPRANDFAMAEFHGPGLKGKSLTHL